METVLWSILISNFPLSIKINSWSHKYLLPNHREKKSASHITLSTLYHSYLNPESGKNLSRLINEKSSYKSYGLHFFSPSCNRMLKVATFSSLFSTFGKKLDRQRAGWFTTQRKRMEKGTRYFFHVFNVGGQTVSCLRHPPTIGLLGLSQSRGPYIKKK